jgi:serine/threonine protein kinase
MTKVGFETSPIRSSSIHEDQTRRLIEILKPVSADLICKFNSSVGSISELSLCVNDSATGALFDDIYDREGALGEGGFAMVYRCVHKKTRHVYAVKEIFAEHYDVNGENLNEEIDALKRLRDCPNIVRLLDVYTEPNKTQMVMEYMTGGDLLERLSEKEVFTEVESRRISRRLLEAISSCHKKQVAHRDIKPENILLADRGDDTKVKLADFGCSRRITVRNCLRTLCGSPYYVAPELYMHEDGYDERCDLWSAGVVIYVIMGGETPFEAPTAQLPEAICDGYFDFYSKSWEEISKGPKDLIKSLLVVNPDDRATLEEALDCQWLRRRDKEIIKRYSKNIDGSSSNTFDAWVKMQNNSSHHSSTAGEVDYYESEKGHDSVRSLYVDDL